MVVSGSTRIRTQPSPNSPASGPCRAVETHPEQSPPKAFQQQCEIDASRFVDASVYCGVLLETLG